MYLYLFVFLGAVFPYKNGHLDGVWAVICGVSICNSSYCPHHVVEFVLRCGSGGVESCLRGVTSECGYGMFCMFLGGLGWNLLCSFEFIFITARGK